MKAWTLFALFLAINVTFLSPQAQAADGGIYGGGGNAECGKMIEDTYMELNEIPGFALFDQARDTVSELTPRFGIRLNKAARSLQWTFVCGDLPYRGDKIGYLIGTEQAAVLEGKTVYVDSRIFNRPSFGERSKAMLIMHESLLYILLDRNRRMNLGLTSEQIHDYVRTVTYKVFAMDKHKRDPNGGWSESELMMVLYENHFGGWITGSTQKKIEGSIPATVNRLSSFFVSKCSPDGNLELRGADLEAVKEIIAETCPSCRKLEFDSIMGAFKLNAAFYKGSRPESLVLYQGPDLQDPSKLMRLFGGPSVCEIAKGHSPTQEFYLRQISCKGWDAVRNSCDVEDLPYDYDYPAGFSDPLWIH